MEAANQMCRRKSQSSAMMEQLEREIHTLKNTQIAVVSTVIKNTTSETTAYRNPPNFSQYLD